MTGRRGDGRRLRAPPAAPLPRPVTEAGLRGRRAGIAAAGHGHGAAPLVTWRPAPAADKRSRDLLAALRPAPGGDGRRSARARPLPPRRLPRGRPHRRPAIGEEATIVCTVESVRVRPTRRRNLVIVEARVRDESGPGVIVWFNQRYLAKQLTPGMRLSVRGERRGSIDAEIVAKRHEILGSEEETTPHLRAGARLPLQREADQPPHRRSWCRRSSVTCGDVPDAVPGEMLARLGLPLRRDALVAAHRPQTLDEAELGRRRLAFDELFLLQAGLISHRRELERTTIARALGRPGAADGAVPGVAAVHAHRRPAACDGRDRPRPRPQHADAAAAAGRRRQRQDAGRRARAAAGGRARRPGGDDGAHRDAGRRSIYWASRRCATRSACG